MLYVRLDVEREHEILQDTSAVDLKSENMATASKIGYKQDLPPAGGYGPIQSERIKLRSVIGWKTGIAGFFITTAIGWVGYSMSYRSFRRNQVEMRGARFVLQAVLLAERDRMFLKQLRKNRDEEADLMKDYPGWEVGTYFGEPIFKTAAKDELIEPQFSEYTLHAPPDGTSFIRMWHRHLS